MGDRVALYLAARKDMTQAQRDDEDELYAKEYAEHIAELEADELSRRADAYYERIGKKD